MNAKFLSAAVAVAFCASNADAAVVLEFVSRTAGHGEKLDRELRGTSFFPKRTRIFIEDESEMAERRQVSSLPTFIIVDDRDSEIARREGMPSRAEYIDFIGTAGTIKISSAPAVTITEAAPVTVTPIPVTDMRTIPWTAPPAAPYTPPAVIVENRIDTKFVGDFVGRTEIEYRRIFDRNTLWTINLTGTPENVDIDMIVLDSRGRIAASESPSGRESLTLAVAPGEYRLRIVLYRQTEEHARVVVPSFVIDESRAPLPAERIVPNFSTRVITINEVTSITPSAEEWYALDIIQPGRYRFDLTGEADVAVFSSAGEMLGERQALISVPGRVFLRVRPGGAPGSAVSITVARDMTVIGAEMEQIIPDRRISGTIGGELGFERFYRIRSAAAGTWQLSLLGPENADLDMEIFRAGELVERSEAPASAETIRFDIEAGGERVVRVYAYRADRPVEYHLELMSAWVEPRRSEEPTTGPMLQNEVAAKGEIGAGETRWYRIQALRSGEYGIFVSGAEMAGDIDLAAHRGEEQIAVSQNDHAREAILVWLNAGETISIRVYAFENSTGGEYEVWYQSLGR